MPREHGDDGSFVETVTLGDVLGVFGAVEGPVVLSADVADALDCSRETARRKLEALHDRGEVERRKVSKRVIYWRPADDDPSPTAGDAATISTDGEDSSAAALAAETLADRGWTAEKEIDASRATSAVSDAVAWLDADGGRRSKTDFIDAGAVSGRSDWERAVRPALQALADAGLVEYRAGHHDYRWRGESADT